MAGETEINANKTKCNKMYIAYKERLQPNIRAEVMALLKPNQCLSAPQNKTA